MTTSEGEMRSEFKRYATFSGFQAPHGVWPSQLAREGFYRSGTCDDNEVVCFSCGVKLDVRTLAKKSLVENHKLSSPNCAFVTGSSGNQPVPGIAFDREAFDDLLQEMEISGHSYTYSHPLRRDSASDGSDKCPTPAPFFPGGNSIPIMQIPLLSDLSAADQADLTSIPMDLIDGLANANLSSLTSASLFGEVENSGLSQSAELFNSVSLLGGSDDDLEYDVEDAGVEGEFPQGVSPSVLQESLSCFATASPPVAIQASAGDISSIEPPKKLDFADLGIITHQPKYQDMRKMQDRLQSLTNKVSSQMVQSDESLAEAGFFYAGYSDCCRCFYCGGGLKSWKDDDEPWIEHARFFKDCPFVLMSKGKDFIDAVQSLTGKLSISMEDVKTKMGQKSSCQSLPYDDVMDETFPDEMETVDFDKVEQNLQSERDSLLQPDLCKICMDKLVNVLFLPCGHLVSCSFCAPTMDKCPVCRQNIHGLVHVQRCD